MTMRYCVVLIVAMCRSFFTEAEIIPRRLILIISENSVNEILNEKIDWFFRPGELMSAH